MILLVDNVDNYRTTLKNKGYFAKNTPLFPVKNRYVSLQMPLSYDHNLGNYAFSPFFSRS